MRAAWPRAWPGRVLLALLLAAPLSLPARHFGCAGNDVRLRRLAAERAAARDSLKVIEVAWAGELERTWKPRLQLAPPDSLAPGFVCVAIDRVGRPMPVGVPPELLRWVNPAEAAPPARVDDWLATRVTTTGGRRWLVARALPAGTNERLTRLSREVARLNDAGLRHREPGGYLAPFLVTWLVLLIPCLGLGRRRP